MEDLLATAAVVAAVHDFRALSSSELVTAVAQIAALRRCVDRAAAQAAAELARRSEPALGDAGLARAGGYLSTEHMIQVLGQVSRDEAVKLVHVGSVITTPAVIAATDAGLSLESVDAIRRGLGSLDDEAAVATVVKGSMARTPGQIFKIARQLRNRLDADGIAKREMEQRDLRAVRTWWDEAGMYCGSWRLPPEEGTIVAEAFDAVMSPRRGGPRFVSTPAARSPFDDKLTTEQAAADAMVDMIRLAVDADPGVIFGRRRPAVRVIVTDTALHARKGQGRIEGHTDPVSFATVERHLCDTGAISLGFDDEGQCVNVGRNRRLFNEKQRIGMAVRDGGCIADGCDRPPSWCEAHHINQWARDDGNTDIADGVLLCRRHHLLLHNTGWQIIRDGGRYFMKPPAVDGEHPELIPLRSHNPIIETMRRAS
ncbi:MAG: DUF222 domain-containing protein [Actinomycetota bacterium]